MLVPYTQRSCLPPDVSLADLPFVYARAKIDGQRNGSPVLLQDQHQATQSTRSREFCTESLWTSFNGVYFLDAFEPSVSRTTVRIADRAVALSRADGVSFLGARQARSAARIPGRRSLRCASPRWLFCSLLESPGASRDTVGRTAGQRSLRRGHPM